MTTGSWERVATSLQVIKGNKHFYYISFIVPLTYGSLSKSDLFYDNLILSMLFYMTY